MKYVEYTLNIRWIYIGFTMILLSNCAVATTVEAEKRVAATAGFVERTLCPLATFRNVERVAISALSIVPFFAGWESVCNIE